MARNDFKKRIEFVYILLFEVLIEGILNRAGDENDIIRGIAEKEAHDLLEYTVEMRKAVVLFKIQEYLRLLQGGLAGDVSEFEDIPIEDYLGDFIRGDYGDDLMIVISAYEALYSRTEVYSKLAEAYWQTATCGTDTLKRVINLLKSFSNWSVNMDWYVDLYLEGVQNPPDEEMLLAAWKSGLFPDLKYYLKQYIDFECPEEMQERYRKIFKEILK